MVERWILCVALLGGLSAGALAQTTQPAIDGTDPRVEMRGNQAFNQGNYVTALPLLQAVAATINSDPQRLGMLQERIRVCQKAIAAAQANPAAAGQTVPGTADIPMDAETRKKHPAPQAGEILAMTIKELGNFQYDDQKGGIPADVKQLNGATLRLRGFMIPMDQADHITQFALVPSLFSCCFGQPPQIQHTIVVTCPKGKAVSYCPDEIVVQGKLTVEEKKDDGYVISLFEVGAESVKVAEK